MRRDDAGSDFLGLQAAAAPARGVTAWLTAALRAAIVRGRLVEGARLPPSRTLAADLGVARGVVVEAYQRLFDEGLVSARPRVGTVVLALDVPPATAAPPTGGDDENVGPPLPVLPPQRAGRAEFDLSPGIPDLAAFPRAAWLRAERAVLRDVSAADLGYGDPRGSSALRRALAGWLATSRGVRADPDDIIVVAGVAQSLALLAQTMRARGETAVGVEDPGSRGVRDELTHWGLTPVPIVVDDHGLRVDELERAGPRVAVLTPAHQFPTGVVLSPARRRALLEWARGDRLVVEDDYDAEHRYDRAPVRALQPYAADHVAHTGSTSKTLAPGMRLGWLVAPRRLRADLIAAKHASDLGSPAIPQLVLARLLTTGEYDRHLRLVRTRQRRRRDAVLAALAEHLPRARVQGVAAGLHLLVMLPDEAGADDNELAAAVRQAGVLVQPLSWHRHRPGTPGLVLGYAAHPPDRLHDAVRRMAAALRADRDRAPGSR
ncbi:MAG TPA: PLP-dependent aminotransferase family protein [Catenuloplanes sp.]|jgi:GntR family transcriptional regulator/MocR family aminotransferase